MRFREANNQTESIYFCFVISSPPLSSPCAFDMSFTSGTNPTTSWHQIHHQRRRRHSTSFITAATLLLSMSSISSIFACNAVRRSHGVASSLGSCFVSPLAVHIATTDTSDYLPLLIHHRKNPSCHRSRTSSILRPISHHPTLSSLTLFMVNPKGKNTRKMNRSASNASTTTINDTSSKIPKLLL